MRYLSVEVQRNLVLSVGTHRGERPLSPIEAGMAIDQEIRQGTSPAELARDLLLRDTTMLPKFRRLLQLAPGVRHLVDWGGSLATVSMSTAAEISRLIEPGDHQLLADAVLTNRLTRIEVQQIVELSLKGILRMVGIEPPKLHDVGHLIVEYAGRLPKEVAANADQIASISKWLRKEREFSFYGDVDLIPTEEYTREDGIRARDDARFIVDQARELFDRGDGQIS